MDSDLIKRAELAFQRGDLQRAQGLCSEILEKSPENAAASLLMGLIAVRQGDFGSGTRWLRTVLRLSPNDYIAHLWLPRALRGSGEPYEAIRAGERSRSLWPNDAEVLSSLSIDYYNIYEYEKSADCLRQAARFEPRNAVLRRKLGSVYETLGRDDEARQEYQASIRLSPGSEDGYVKLGRLLCGHGNYSQVIELCEEALRVLQRPAQVHLVYAHALKLVGESEAAESQLQAAIALDPEITLAAALWMNEDGRFEEAAVLFQESIDRRPVQGLAYQGLFMGRRARPADRDLIGSMRSVLNDSGLPLRERAALLYALGKTADDLGDYQQAMDYFDAGNRLKHQIFLAGKRFDLQQLAFQREQTVSLFTPDFMAKNSALSSDSHVPIFVIGMIRSGTTLLEQIIAAHPMVGSAGEQRFWISELPRAVDLDAQTLDTARFADATERYLELLRGLQPDIPHVTDKMPMNFMCAGLLHLAYPNAPIVHIKRNPVDNALSIYMTDLAKPPEFAHDKRNIVEAYLEYERLMDLWRTVVPSTRLLEVNYEDLISDQELWTRKVIEFCGLEWDLRCLEFHKNSGQVNTPSMWQVRQPIYKTSVEKWRNYEPWLGEFAELIRENPL